MIRPVALALTLVTGFSALAYEVAWQRYLATLLGAQSEATAAVLAIFLGGLSVGYRVFGALTRRLVRGARAHDAGARLLRVYGGVEAGIGVYALLFPWTFRAAQAVSLWLPTGGGLVAFGADVVLATALIAPPAILMGATIPLLTQALARDLEDATHLHSLVYALNTIGAFVGALAAGFVLVRWWGLDGVARAMGVLNLAAGASYLALGARRRPAAQEIAGAKAPPEPPPVPPPVRYRAAALLVGFATMACQTVLIRLGGLALGSSEFTFTIVVAAFVSAIAAGSLAVAAAPRIGRAVLPATLWALAIAFGALYFVLDDAPYWAHVLRTMFRDHDEAFYAYQTAVLLAVLAVIGPPAALSGASLPLLFDALRREMGDLGDRAGRLYSQNTVGSLLGALIGGYVLLFWLDLHHVYRVALAAFAIAAALVTPVGAGALGRGAALGLAASVGLVLLALPPWDPAHLASGLFRQRERAPWSYGGPDARPYPQPLFYEDDPTSSVAVVGIPQRNLSIVVNGKSDGNTVADLGTMGLAALLPALFADHAERAFVIGYGTGITAGTLAELDEMSRVTVAEISSGVLDAAPLFDFANFGASHHPKLDFVRSDAFRALLRSDERFDIIVSEPSNPWVAGIETLFSVEFLRAARDHLAPGGVYVQWYHRYETNDRAFELVLQNYARVYERVSVWQTNPGDFLLLGFEGSGEVDVERLLARFTRPDYAALLARLGIEDPLGLLVHEILPEGVVAHSHPSALPAHTLYHPRLGAEAGRGFFTNVGARLRFTGYGEPARIGKERSLLRRYLLRNDALLRDPEAWHVLIDRACREGLSHCGTLVAARPPEVAVDEIPLDKQRSRQALGLDDVARIAQLYDPEGHAAPLSPHRARRLARVLRERYYHAFPFPEDALVSLWQRCRENGAFGPACRAGLAEAEARTAPERGAPGA
jgi:spermidine synthase